MRKQGFYTVVNMKTDTSCVATGNKSKPPGKFRYTPEIEKAVVDLPEAEAMGLKDKIIDAVEKLTGIRAEHLSL